MVRQSKQAFYQLGIGIGAAFILFFHQFGERILMWNCSNSVKNHIMFHGSGLARHFLHEIPFWRPPLKRKHAKTVTLLVLSAFLVVVFTSSSWIDTVSTEILYYNHGRFCNFLISCLVELLLFLFFFCSLVILLGI